MDENVHFLEDMLKKYIQEEDMEQIQTIIDKNDGNYQTVVVIYELIIRTGSLKVVNHFKEKIRQIIVATNNELCISSAIANQNIEVFKLIMELGANQRIRKIPNTLFSAVLNGKVEILKILLQEIPEMIN